MREVSFADKSFNTVRLPDRWQGAGRPKDVEAAQMIRRRILITGASSGLGAGMARAFAAMGRDLRCAPAASTAWRAENRTVPTSFGHHRRDRRTRRRRPAGFRSPPWPTNSAAWIASSSTPGSARAHHWAPGNSGPTRRQSRPIWFRHWCRSRRRWRSSLRRDPGTSC